MRRLASVLVLGLLVATGCKKISGDKVEEIITNMFKEKGITVKAACPDGLEIKKDSVFKCTAKESGRDLTINVTVLDEEGTVRAVLDGMFVFTDKLAPAVKQKDNLDIKCSAQTIVITPTQPGICEIVGNDQFKKLQIDQVDPEKGEVTWKAIP